MRDVVLLFDYKNSLVMSSYLKSCLSLFLGYEMCYDEPICVTAGRYYFSGMTRSKADMYLLLGKNRCDKYMYAKELQYQYTIPYDTPYFNRKMMESVEKYRDAVVLNPYGKSFSSLNKTYAAKVWDSMCALSKKLSEAGIKVYTNAIGNQKELPNSEKLDCPLYELAHIARICKGVVTTFSGIMEFLMIVRCNLIVLTPGSEQTRVDIASQCDGTSYHELLVDEAGLLDDISRILMSDYHSPDVKYAINENRPTVEELCVPQIMADAVRRAPQYIDAITSRCLDDNKFDISDILKDQKGVEEAYVNSAILWKLGLYQEALRTMDEHRSSANHWIKNKWFEMLIRSGSKELSERSWNFLEDHPTVSNSFANFVADSYQGGVGVEANIAQAEYWIRKAAANNDDKSRARLFDILWKRNDPDTYKEMADLAKDMSDSGRAGGMYRLGRLYCRGKGVPKDMNKAEECLRAAIDKGNRPARIELFDILWTKGTEEASKEAVSLIRNMFEEGHTYAKMCMAKAYREGRGVEKNVEMADRLEQEARNQIKKK